ncbi:MAG: hypothetical protein KAW13_03840 [Dehalococcoidia bacterium]|nr:hypothetical protein [Dehalococcoidia bacterium]
MISKTKAEKNEYNPIVAAVNGYCLAGRTEMTPGTDIRIAADHATFAIVEAKGDISNHPFLLTLP